MEEVFERLKKFKKGLTSISVSKVTSASSGEVEVEFINEDPNVQEEGLEIETFEYEADVSVQDFGIGSYEFWGFKGVDTQIGYEVECLSLLGDWPEELKWVKEIIEERIAEDIGQLNPKDDRDF